MILEIFFLMVKKRAHRTLFLQDHSRSHRAASGTRRCQEAFSQLTENAVPAPLRAPGSALVAPELSTIVISSSVNEEMLPAVLSSVTAALEAVQVQKSVSGSTPPDPVVAGPVGGRDVAQALEARGCDALPVVGRVITDHQLPDLRDGDRPCLGRGGMGGGGGAVPGEALGPGRVGAYRDRKVVPAAGGERGGDDLPVAAVQDDAERDQPV
jgi:hypothetical protein